MKVGNKERGAKISSFKNEDFAKSISLSCPKKRRKKFKTQESRNWRREKSEKHEV